MCVISIDRSKISRKQWKNEKGWKESAMAVEKS